MNPEANTPIAAIHAILFLYLSETMRSFTVTLKVVYLFARKPLSNHAMTGRNIKKNVCVPRFAVHRK